ncbi:MAG: hypothetical protein V1697_02000 [Candidatus Levyibacteriota bacterium]
MKIIVTHVSPDLDGIASIWLVKKYLPGWNEAVCKFVSAGKRLKGFENTERIIETNGKDEVIHVDTGLGPLDHHQIDSVAISAISLTKDYVLKEYSRSNPEMVKHDKWKYKKEAIARMAKVIIDIDHFQEIFWQDPANDHHEFGLLNILDGLKIEKPNQDKQYVEFGCKALDALLHEFENKIWAEDEIKNKGIIFETSFGKGIGLETINDEVVKLAQKMGFLIVVRKDPRKGYARIKTMPDSEKKKNSIDLTPVYNKLKSLDPDAHWFLHISKKMLLNGSSKSPDFKPTKLSLADIIKELEKL